VDVAAIVASIKATKKKQRRRRVEMKLWDKIRAPEMWAKHFTLLKEGSRYTNALPKPANDSPRRNGKTTSDDAPPPCHH
jgi:hypothetical protein